MTTVAVEAARRKLKSASVNMLGMETKAIESRNLILNFVWYRIPNKVHC